MLHVTHVWDDAGGRKTHTERVAPPFAEPHLYTLACGPGPALRSIIMEAESAAV
jgi:hypothetical protein